MAISKHVLNSIPDQTPCKWVIHFRNWPLDRKSASQGYKGPVASDFPECLKILEERVKPERLTKAADVAKAPWWQFWRIRSELEQATHTLDRVLVRSRVANLHSLVFLPKSVCCSDAIVVFAFDDYGAFSCLQSSAHIVWLEFYASSMRTDIRYTPTDCFETFPFPSSLSGTMAIGEVYYGHRRSLMLKRQEGLTKTYNRFHNPDESDADIQKLRDLHVEMDQAVAAAYRWDDLNLGHGFHETKQGLRFTISEPARREVLQRLLKLNHERYAEEVKQGLHDKKKRGAGTGNRGSGKKKKKAAKKSSRKQEPSLFDKHGGK